MKQDEDGQNERVSFPRQLNTIKQLMDKRIQQRGIALYYLYNGKMQSAIIHARQLTFTSSRIFKQFKDEFEEPFQEVFFSRTNRYRENLQYLLDIALLSKIYIQAKKKQDLTDIFEKFQILQCEVKRFPSFKTQKQIIEYNQYHEIHARTISILLTFIDLAKGQKLHEYVEKFFKIYLNYVKKYYSVIQYATALFKYGNYLYQSGLITQAIEQLKLCLFLRQKNSENESVVDTLVNLTICQRQVSNYKQASFNMERAIQIFLDVSQNEQRLSDLYLFLGKIYLQSAQFQKAQANMLRCYQLRQKMDIKNPARVEIQLNLLFLIKTLRDIYEKPQAMLNIKSKKQIEIKKKKAMQVEAKIRQQLLNREDFAKYKQFKSSKMAHLVLIITREFFQCLGSQQIDQLNKLLNRIAQLSLVRGVHQLQKCTFWQQKKTRTLLIDANPHIQQVKIK